MKKNSNDILSDVYHEIFHLRADILHECCLGRLDPNKVSWIHETLNDIEGYIYENSKRCQP